jgi:hypothetical protein
MTYNEANSQNEFFYTGASWRGWDTEKGEKYKAEAKALKKKFKGVDFRIVTDKNGWKSIYGNDLYHKVQYFNEEVQKKWIDGHFERVKKLNEEHKKQLDKLNEDLAKAIKEYDEIISLKRV